MSRISGEESKMKLSKEDFHWAASKGVISTDQANQLWQVFSSRESPASTFDIAHVTYYFGALIVISAMGWFMTLGWENFGGGGILVISCTYALCFVLAARTLWYEKNLRVPGGLLFTLAVWMTPLAIYGFERMVGFWTMSDPGTFHDFHVWIRGSWIFMELGTILAGLIALRFIHFPFLTFPVAFTLWYMSMDLTPILVRNDHFSWNSRLWVSAVFGAIMLLFAYVIDQRTEQDFAFWLYLFGMMAFWGGLSLMESGSEASKFVYSLINVGLMFLSVLLNRRVFIVFGALGVFGYLGHLSWTVFKNSMMFPFVLTFIGILVIFIGVQYQRNRAKIEQSILGLVPPELKRLLPRERLARS
jgi:hypothetical protein